MQRRYKPYRRRPYHKNPSWELFKWFAIGVIILAAIKQCLVG